MSGWALDVHYGWHVTFPGSIGPRFDIGAKVPVSPSVRVGGGVAALEGLRGRNEYEGRLDFELQLADPSP
jgi:hypothetical protein